MNDFVKMLETKKMTLIMSMPFNDAEFCRSAFGAGADVVKVHSNLSHHASSTHFLPFEDYKALFCKILDEAQGPVGLVPGTEAGQVAETVKEASKLPFSFFSLYAHHAPLSVLSLPQALMAACAHDYTLQEAAAFSHAGVSVMEASVIPPDGYGKPLTVKDLIGYRLLCGSTPLPVVVPTQRRILSEDLPSLKEAGVKGIMIGAVVTGKEPAEILKAISIYRDAIERL